MASPLPPLNGDLQLTHPSSPPAYATNISSAALTSSDQQVFGRFPPTTRNFGQDLDPYFANHEASSRELEALLQGSREKVDEHTFSHLSSILEDLVELGARFNGFSLFDKSTFFATALVKLPTPYIATGDLSASLKASFSEPMRPSAQFAGIMRSVLPYRTIE